MSEIIVEYLRLADLITMCVGAESAVRRYKDKCYFLGSMGDHIVLAIAKAPEKHYRYAQWKIPSGEIILRNDYVIDSESKLVKIYDVKDIQPKELKAILEAPYEDTS